MSVALIGLLLMVFMVPAKYMLESDSVARPLQNFKQFNGDFGCSFCLQKGTLVERGQGKARVYPFEEAVDLRSDSKSDFGAYCKGC